MSVQTNYSMRSPRKVRPIVGEKLVRLTRALVDAGEDLLRGILGRLHLVAL
jgi:hypothetical protein